MDRDGRFELDELQVAQFRARFESENRRVAPQIFAPCAEFPESGEPSAREHDGAGPDEFSVFRPCPRDALGSESETDDPRFENIRFQQSDRLLSGCRARMHNARETGSDGVHHAVETVRCTVEADSHCFEPAHFRHRPVRENPHQFRVGASAA